jgi:two-component system, LytTR family, response regulator
MINALIIDDEPDGRDALRLSIEKYCPEVVIKGIYETPEEGLAAIQKLKPNLVFLDVQMPHMSGFDLLQKLSPVSFEVIFVTAHDQYAIKAIRFSALDYLLKPVDIDDLLHAIQKVKDRLQQKNSAHKYQSVLNNIQFNSKKIEKLAVPSMDGIEFFNTDDIIFCQADSNYTRLFLKNKQIKLISKNLKDFEGNALCFRLLPGSSFFFN